MKIESVMSLSEKTPGQRPKNDPYRKIIVTTEVRTTHPAPLVRSAVSNFVKTKVNPTIRGDYEIRIHWDGVNLDSFEVKSLVALTPDMIAKFKNVDKPPSTSNVTNTRATIAAPVRPAASTVTPAVVLRSPAPVIFPAVRRANPNALPPPPGHTEVPLTTIIQSSRWNSTSGQPVQNTVYRPVISAQPVRPVVIQQRTPRFMSPPLSNHVAYLVQPAPTVQTTQGPITVPPQPRTLTLQSQTIVGSFTSPVLRGPVPPRVRQAIRIASDRPVNNTVRIFTTAQPTRPSTQAQPLATIVAQSSSQSETFNRKPDGVPDSPPTSSTNSSPANVFTVAPRKPMPLVYPRFIRPKVAHVNQPSFTQQRVTVNGAVPLRSPIRTIAGPRTILPKPQAPGSGGVFTATNSSQSTVTVDVPQSTRPTVTSVSSVNRESETGQDKTSPVIRRGQVRAPLMVRINGRIQPAQPGQIIRRTDGSIVKVMADGSVPEVSLTTRPSQNPIPIKSSAEKPILVDSDVESEEENTAPPARKDMQILSTNIRTYNRRRVDQEATSTESGSEQENNGARTEPPKSSEVVEEPTAGKGPYTYQFAKDGQIERIEKIHDLLVMYPQMEFKVSETISLNKEVEARANAIKLSPDLKDADKDLSLALNQVSEDGEIVLNPERFQVFIECIHDSLVEDENILEYMLQQEAEKTVLEQLKDLANNSSSDSDDSLVGIQKIRLPKPPAVKLVSPVRAKTPPKSPPPARFSPTPAEDETETDWSNILPDMRPKAVAAPEKLQAHRPSPSRAPSNPIIVNNQAIKQEEGLLGFGSSPVQFVLDDTTGMFVDARDLAAQSTEVSTAQSNQPVPTRQDPSPPAELVPPTPSPPQVQRLSNRMKSLIKDLLPCKVVLDKLRSDVEHCSRLSLDNIASLFEKPAYLLTFDFNRNVSSLANAVYREPREPNFISKKTPAEGAGCGDASHMYVDVEVTRGTSCGEGSEAPSIAPLDVDMDVIRDDPCSSESRPKKARKSFRLRFDDMDDYIPTDEGEPDEDWVVSSKRKKRKEQTGRRKQIKSKTVSPLQASREATEESQKKMGDVDIDIPIETDMDL